MRGSPVAQQSVGLKEETMAASVRFGKVTVGSDHPPYIVAEIGSNHNGDIGLCRRLVDAAVDAGAHAVKFQSWSDTSLISEEEYARNTEYADRKRHFGSLREMVKAYQFTPDQHRMAQAHCASRGIAFCSTPFSFAEVDLLDALDVPFLKIASMDVVHIPLLKHAARTGRPVVLSTGMATMAEIECAVDTIRGEGNDQVVLLHCVSIYPPDMSSVHLRNIGTLQRAFELPVGFSDHTLGTAIPLAAIALGACVIEKHFTLDKGMPGWDHAISADPPELRALTDGARHVFMALGSCRRRVSDAELEKRKKFRRSLVATADLPADHLLTDDDLDAKRPGTGIAPNELSYVVGRRLACAVRRDQVLAWSDLV
jgi:N,N'-diacetyllegionaminate synthase